MRALIFGLVLGLVGFAAGHSQAITISFDEGNQGVNPVDNAAVGASYAALGVNFASTAFHLVNGGVSPALFGINHLTDGGNPEPSDPIIITFDAGTYADGIAAASVLAVGVGNQGVLVEAFDAVAGGNLVDSFVLADGGGADILVTLSGGGIFRLELSQNTTVGIDALFFDDLFFTVPEPGAMAILGAGLLGLAGFRRRQKRG